MNRFITLTADVVFVNVNLFMITSARKLRFVTFEHITS